MNDNEEICEPLKIRRLDINDRISNFNCGDEDLNDFILNESQLYRGEMLAVTYVEEIQEVKDGRIRVKRHIDGGVETVEGPSAADHRCFPGQHGYWQAIRRYRLLPA